MTSTALDADLLIVGGGTAGLAVAIYARLAGLSAIVIDPRQGTQDKACGEGLLPSTRLLLDEMGLQIATAMPLRGIRYVAGGQTAEGLFPDGDGVGVRRTVLNAALQERARALGVRFHYTRAGRFEDAGSHVTVAGLCGRWLVGCDGLRSSVRAQLGVAMATSKPHRFGMRRHYRVRDWPPFVEVHWYEGFEVYITPVTADTVNVAVLFGEGRQYAECMAKATAVVARLGEPVNEARGAGPFGRWTTTPRVGNVFLAGDAAGFIDPLTGEGNHLAMAAARELVLCLATEVPQLYPQRWRRLVRGYQVLTHGLLWLGRHKRLRRLIVPVMQHAPVLFRLAFAVLAFRPAEPRLTSPHRPARLAGAAVATPSSL